MNDRDDAGMFEDAGGCRADHARVGKDGARERYRNALGSARETGACIDVAVALGYVESVDASLLDALDKVRATLVRVLT